MEPTSNDREYFKIQISNVDGTYTEHYCERLEDVDQFIKFNGHEGSKCSIFYIKECELTELGW